MMGSAAKPKVAVLMTGAYREVEFLLRLFPHMAGTVEYDIYLVLRHVRTDESSHFGAREGDFKLARLEPYVGEGLFLCELPSVDPGHIESRYLIPVGPTSPEREHARLSMFHGVFTAIAMMKSSLRGYTHVMKTRTDYLPLVAPWLSGMLETYEHAGCGIVVDGSLTVPWRYPDRLDIPWQGSINDVFCFASVDQFLSLWDIQDIMVKVWTGTPETTLFRAAMVRLLGDDLQSPRRNDSFLKRHFMWQRNDTKQSFNMLRAGVLSGEMKQMLGYMVESDALTAEAANKLICISYDFIIGTLLEKRAVEDDVAAKLSRESYPGKADLQRFAGEWLPDGHAKGYLETCYAAAGEARPV